MNIKMSTRHWRWTHIALLLALLLVILFPVSAAYRMQRPITYDGGRLNQSYLYGEVWNTNTHKGVDLTYDFGTDVYAIADGVVVDIDESVDNDTNTGRSSFGNFVLIRNSARHWDRTTQQWAYVYTIFAHLAQWSVQPIVGQFVSAGEWIADVDNTGYSSGDHLHLQICIHPQSDRMISTLSSSTTSRNPELWLQAFNDGGTNTGTVIGKVTDSNGQPIGDRYIWGLSKSQGSGGTIYKWSRTYAYSWANPDDILVENWGTTDVLPGFYHLFVKNESGTYTYADLGWHTVEAGRTTYVGLYPIYLPDIVENYDGWNSSIVIRNNSDSETAQVNTTFFRYDGAWVHGQKTDYLAPKSSVIVDFPGYCYYCRGSAIVSASQDVSVVVERSGNGRYDNYNGIAAGGLDLGWGQTGTNIAVPLAKYNFNGKTSRFYIQNTGGNTTDVTLTGYTDTGTQAFNVVACTDLAPNARCDPRTPTTIAGRYAVRITASQPLAVVVAEESHNDPNTVYKLQNSFAAGANAAYVPQVKSTTTDYTTLAVQNIGSVGTQVGVSYYGGNCSAQSQWVSANSYEVFEVTAACPLGFVGAARVSGGQPLAVLVNEAGEKGYSGFLTSSQTTVVTHVRRDAGWWTGIRVMNGDGNSLTYGTIWFYNSDGTLHSHPGFNIVGSYNSVNLGNLVPVNWSGSAVIKTDRPIVTSVILTLNGSTQQTMMTNANNR